MSFNIYQLDGLDTFDENALWNYRDSLIRLFVQSPDGQAYSGFWVDNLVYYGYAQAGVTLPHMTVEHVDYVVTKLFPVNISLNAPEEADSAIPELLAFWHYLRFEYDLPQADAISIYLADTAPKFRELMSAPSTFGVAEPTPTTDPYTGYDVTGESAGGLTEAYDEHAIPQETSLSQPGVKQPSTLSDKEKKKRKAAKSARKKGRRK